MFTTGALMHHHKNPNHSFHTGPFAAAHQKFADDLNNLLPEVSYRILHNRGQPEPVHDAAHAEEGCREFMFSSPAASG